MTRTRGTMVRPLSPEVWSGFDRYALGINPHTGETFLIHSEGVSYPIRHGKPWRFNDYDVTARFYTQKEVQAFETDEAIDLADWIRAFGARLESNYGLAYGLLNRTSPAIDIDDMDDKANHLLLEGL